MHTVVIGGRIMTTPEEVFENYRPHPKHMMSEQQWEICGPVARAAARRANLGTVGGALKDLQTLAHFMAWALKVDIDTTDPEVLLTPANVERYFDTGMEHLAMSSRATRRSALRRVAKGATRRAPWEPDPSVAGPLELSAPYTQEQTAQLVELIGKQATAHRVRVMSAAVSLGLGVGAYSYEVLAVRGEHVREFADFVLVSIPGARARQVPVAFPYSDLVLDLARAYPDEPLFGVTRDGAKDPVGARLQHLEIPPSLRPFSIDRLRKTWKLSLLALGMIPNEYMYFAGVVTMKGVEELASRLRCREQDDLMYRIAAEARP